MILYNQGFRALIFVTTCLLVQHCRMSNCEEASYISAASYAQPTSIDDFGPPAAAVTVTDAGTPIETSVISYGLPQLPAIYNQPLPSPLFPPYPLGLNNQLIDFQALSGSGGGWGWNGPQILPLLLQQQQQFPPPQLLGNFYGTPGWGWPRPLSPFLR